MGIKLLCVILRLFGVPLILLSLLAMPTEGYLGAGIGMLLLGGSMIGLAAYLNSDAFHTLLEERERERYKAVKVKSGNFKAAHPNVFLSYRRSDSETVTGRIYDHLVAKAGKDFIFKDVDSIFVGEDFVDAIDSFLSTTDVVIAVIGPTWATAEDANGELRLFQESDFVRREIEASLNLNIPTVPVLVEGASMPTTTLLPDSLKKLSRRNAMEVRADPDFHRDIDRLSDAISKLSTKPPILSASTTTSRVKPNRKQIVTEGAARPQITEAEVKTLRENSSFRDHPEFKKFLRQDHSLRSMAKRDQQRKFADWLQQFVE